MDHTDQEKDPEVVYHPGDKTQLFWTKCDSGWIAGVCQSMAPKFGLTPHLMRLLWVIATIVSFGTAVILYFACAISFPNVDELGDEDPTGKKMILGVSIRLAKALRCEVALVRVVLIVLLFASLGATAILYLIAHFFIPEDPQPIR